MVAAPPTSPQFTTGEHPLLVFFDGECVFCNQWVEKLMRADAAANRLRYGPKQGPTFQQVAAKFPEVANVDSIVLIHRAMDNHEVALIRSRAVAQIVQGLPSFQWLQVLLAITPTFLADIGYRFFSKTRFFFWGRMNQCHVPRPEERSRFVD